MSIELGQRVVDDITNFTGIVTARAVYLTGCVQICVTPRADKDGKLQPCEWFDEGRLRQHYQDERGCCCSEPASEPTGGPQDTPPQRHA